MIIKHTDIFSTSLVIRKMQIKITRRHHFTAFRAAVTFKNNNKIIIIKLHGEIVTLYIADRNVKWYFMKNHLVASQKANLRITI